MKLAFSKGKTDGASGSPPDTQDAAQAKEPSEAPLVRIFERVEFYRDQYRKAWLTIYIISGVCGLSMLLNIIQFTTREHPQNYAVTPDLRVVPLTPLNEELINPESVRNWAARIATKSYSLNFRDYRQQLADLEPEFTKDGYEGFLESLKRADLINTIRTQNYVVSAVVTQTPTIIGTGQFKGAFFWKISAPILVTFQSGASTNTQNLVVSMVALRVPETRNGAGIAVQSFVAQRAGGGS